MDRKHKICFIVGMILIVLGAILKNINPSPSPDLLGDLFSPIGLILGVYSFLDTTAILNQHTQILNQHTQILNQHTELLRAILEELRKRGR
jgi:hypothetical protein